MYLLILSTWACNLQCSYCRVRKKNLFISEETLKKSVDFLLTSRDKELKFEFFGGEPLLLPFSVLKKVITYGEKKAKKKGKKIDFIITTNAILLDERKIDFFKKHNVLLIISLDGSRESQNINRPQAGKKDSYSLIVKNLPLIFKKGVDCYCYTVVTPETVNFLEDNFRSLVNLGFKKIWLMMACGVDWKPKDIAILEKGVKNICRIYPSLLAKKGIVLLNLKNWLSPFRMNTELSVNLDGCLYSACLTYLIADEEKRKKFVLGHIDNLTESIDELNKKRLTNEQAMNIIYGEQKILHTLPSNIKVGRMLAELFKKLRRKIFADEKLKKIYESRSK